MRHCSSASEQVPQLVDLITRIQAAAVIVAGIASIPVRELRGVGPKLAAKLADYGVHQVEDLLFHLPLRYQDRTRVTPIAAAREGADLVIEGEVRASGRCLRSAGAAWWPASRTAAAP